MKKSSAFIAGLLAGAVLILSIPMVFAHEEDTVLGVLAKLLQQNSEQLKQNQESIDSFKSVVNELRNEVAELKKKRIYQLNNGQWSSSISSNTWTQVGEMLQTVAVDRESILLMTANGHVDCNDQANHSLYVSFFVDNTQTQPSGSDWGQYHIYENVTDGWAPLSITQMYTVASGEHTVRLQAKCSGTWEINGVAMQILVIPK